MHVPGIASLINKHPLIFEKGDNKQENGRKWKMEDSFLCWTVSHGQARMTRVHVWVFGVSSVLFTRRSFFKIPWWRTVTIHSAGKPGPALTAAALQRTRTATSYFLWLSRESPLAFWTSVNTGWRTSTNDKQVVIISVVKPQSPLSPFTCSDFPKLG